MANPDNKGQADIVADTDGEGFVRIDGKYLADVLKACGGMVDFSLTNALSPMLFTTNGYQVVVMPMITDKAQAEAKAKATVPSEPSGEVEPQSVTSQGTVETEQAEPEEPAKPANKPKKAKRSRAKEPVTAK